MTRKAVKSLCDHTDRLVLHGQDEFVQGQNNFVHMRSQFKTNIAIVVFAH